VTLRISGNVVEILDENSDRVAIHERRYSGSRYVTIFEHMPPNHRHQAKFNGFDGRRYSDWAKKIGDNTTAVIDRLLKQQDVEEQAYRSCMGILQMSQTYGNERLEAACAMALGMSAASYTTIRNILKNGRDPIALPRQTQPPNMKIYAATCGSERGEKMINQTLEKLQAMKQAAMAAEYRRQLETVAMNELTFEERLAMIVDAQWLSRQNARLKRLLHTANLRDPAATLSNLPTSRRECWIRIKWRGFPICNGYGTVGTIGYRPTERKNLFGQRLWAGACRAGMTVRCYKMTGYS
jgi:hypothetical protein